MRLSLPLLFACGLTTIACAAPATGRAATAEAGRADASSIANSAVKLRDSALKANDAGDIVESLTTEVGPRPAGSAGDRAAVAWAQQKLRQLGFSQVRTQDVLVPHWIRGEASFQVLEPYPMEMPTLALGGSIGTPDDGLRGEVIAVRDLEALRALTTGSVSGRIVFFTGRTERTRDGAGYGKAVRQRAEGPSAASALGAIGVVIRSISTSNTRAPHTGSISYNIAAPRIPAIAIANPDADALERQLAGGRKVVASMRVTARDLPQVHSANVIGEISGTDKADEIVLLGAHLDSWDPGVGAIDDGAGVAIVMAAARQLAQANPRPRRTIRVVLFANEEFGLSGSRVYAGDAAMNPEKHVLAMEADLGAGPVWRLDASVPEAAWPLVQQMQKLLASTGVTLGKNGTGGGSDIGPLRQRGVPTLGPQLDASLYFDVHHSADDTMAMVDPKALNQAVAAYAVAAYIAAMEPSDVLKVTSPAPAAAH